MPKTPAHELPITRDFNYKKGIITYRMTDIRRMLPPIVKVWVDDTKLKVELKDGNMRHLPDLNKGYVFDKQTKYELTFKKIA